jgi:ABC-type Na+ efflux pump permease subunit
MADEKEQKELTLIQKYDTVLDVLYTESGKSPTFDDILGKLGTDGYNIHWGEVWDVINTMIKDGFIYQVIQEDDPEKKPRYLLSFNGKLLKETGGLEKKLAREKKKEETNVLLDASNLKTGRWTRTNIIITIVTGSITLIAVLTNLGITINRESKESIRQLRDSIQQAKTQENASELNKNIHQIHQALQDTAKVKVKIEK